MTAKLKIAAQTEIKIEKGLPFSDSYASRHRYPWNTMDVGDSFLFSSDLADGTGYRLAHQASLVHKPKKFKVKTTPQGFRCWRTE